MTKSNHPIVRAAIAAFPPTIPIGFAFFTLGISYGILMTSKGFPIWYPALMSAVIYTGSMEFVTIELLLGAFNPVLAFVIALMVGARHLFYGIGLLKTYRGTGWKKPYLIFTMCDESFAVNSSAHIPEDVDRGWFYFFVTLFNQLYWIVSSTLGAIAGSFITFDTTGLEFVLTAMFATLFIEEWLNSKQHASATIGVLASLGCLLIFGPDSFLIPTMVCIVVAFGVRYVRMMRHSSSPTQPDCANSTTAENSTEPLSERL